MDWKENARQYALMERERKANAQQYFRDKTLRECRESFVNRLVGLGIPESAIGPMYPQYENVDPLTLPFSLCCTADGMEWVFVHFADRETCALYLLHEAFGDDTPFPDDEGRGEWRVDELADLGEALLVIDEQQRGANGCGEAESDHRQEMTATGSEARP